MVTVGLLVRLEARPGKEAEVERFLRGGLTLVEAEPATTVWFGIRLGPSTFGIFDAFPDEAGRSAHLSGRVAAALGEKAAELLAEPPTIERLEVLAVKLPR
jgi:quinol monooxygenase YgiN